MRRSPNGGNGRDGQGRFLPGNPGGPGNPLAGRVHQYRTALAEAVTEDDIRAVIGKLVAAARAGERWAIRELLDRCLGKPMQTAALLALDGRAEDHEDSVSDEAVREALDRLIEGGEP